MASLLKVDQEVKLKTASDIGGREGRGRTEETGRCCPQSPAYFS
ncbi:PSME3 isoform 13 [Pongo abelii]|uniref:PSME3 isoform 13 n=1 Tax=Pongo abelii TaxID=9601 RepID=A0A2J8RET1_PONAB|nr:PSME3 isoform 13 [Pongo abelii]